MAGFNDIVHDSFLITELSLRLMVRFSEVYRYSLCTAVQCAVHIQEHIDP